MNLTPPKLRLLIAAMDCIMAADAPALRIELKEELQRCEERGEAVRKLLEAAKPDSVATSDADKLAREILVPVLLKQNILLDDLKKGYYHVEWQCLEHDLIALFYGELGKSHGCVNLNRDGTMDWF
jgi:hypothetical protein